MISYYGVLTDAKKYIKIIVLVLKNEWIFLCGVLIGCFRDFLTTLAANVLPAHTAQPIDDDSRNNGI